MSNFGEFEVVEEHHRGSYAVVLRARRSTDSTGAFFAVKRLSREMPPEEREAETADDAVGPQLLREAAEEQRVIAERHPDSWQPVIEVGGPPHDPFCVGPFQARSIERVIDGRVGLEAQDLHWLVQGVMRGLCGLEAALHRPHGRLKPANVFIGGKGRLRGAVVLLTDLKPRSTLNLSADRAADLAALGRMVVQLVRRKGLDTRTSPNWPCEASEEWKRLGSDGDRWRELCNDLLRPVRVGPPLELAEVAQRIEALAPVVRPRWLWPTLAVGAMGMVAAGVLAFYFRIGNFADMSEGWQAWAERFGNPGERHAQAPEEWGKLCTAYYNWLGEFESQVLNGTAFPAVLADPYLKERVFGNLIEASRREMLDPRKLAEDPRAGVLELGANPPASVRLGSVIRKIRAVWLETEAAVHHARAWPKRLRLGDVATELRALGWSGPADELQALVGRVGQVELRGQDLAAVIDQTPRAETALRGWARIKEKGVPGSATVDAIIEGFPDYARRRLASTRSMAELIWQLAELAREQERLWTALLDEGEFDYRRFRQESFVAAWKGEVSAADLARWEKVLGDFRVLPMQDDPRRSVNWDEARRRISDQLEVLGNEERLVDNGGSGGAGEELRKRWQEVTQRHVRLLDRKLVVSDLTAVAREVDQLRIEWDELERATRVAVSRASPAPGPWLEQVRKARIQEADTPAQRMWAARRDALLGAAEPSRLVPGNEFRSLRAAYQNLESQFRLLVGAQGLGTLPAFDPTGIDDALARELVPAAEEILARTTQALLDLWPSGTLVAKAAEILASPSAQKVKATHLSSLRVMTETGRLLSDLGARLAQGAGWDDNLDRQYGEISRRPEFERLANLSAVQRLKRTLGDLRQLRTDADPAKALEAANDGRFALALAGWQRLSELKVSASTDTIAKEAELLHRIFDRIAREVADSKQREKLERELKTRAAQRWHLMIRGAKDDARMSLALSYREKFWVPEESLGSRELYNVELHRLKQVEWKALDEGEAGRRRHAAVSRLRSLLGKQEGGASRWLEEIAEIPLSNAGAPADLRRLGPAERGWTGEFLPDGTGVVYRWKGASAEHRLEFVFVHSDTTPPFLLCTTELTVGLLLDLLAQPGVALRLRPWLDAIAGEEDSDVRTGPKVWVRDPRRGIVLNESWTGHALPHWPRPLYPKDFPEVGAPSRQHPAQYLPPTAALFLARDVLGCRLPSPDEWAGAVAAMGQPADHANLRDEAWQKMHDYLLARSVTISAPEVGEEMWPRALGPRKVGREAVASISRNDGHLWFAEVEAGGGEPFHHLVGNVAEFLHDAENNAFFVAGGSALSGPEIAPSVPYPFDGAPSTVAFPDVGLRLALSAPGGLAGRVRLQQAIRNQTYLKL